MSDNSHSNGAEDHVTKKDTSRISIQNIVSTAIEPVAPKPAAPTVVKPVAEPLHATAGTKRKADEIASDMATVDSISNADVPSEPSLTDADSYESSDESSIAEVDLEVEPPAKRVRTPMQLLDTNTPAPLHPTEGGSTAKTAAKWALGGFTAGTAVGFVGLLFMPASMFA